MTWKLILLLLVSAGVAVATLSAGGESSLMKSTRAPHDVAPDTDPHSAFWRGAIPTYADADNFGRSQPQYKTTILSRWTSGNLYLLFECPYEELYLKPSPNTTSETNELWNWDVAEAFIGSDFKNIRHYKEFEVSPQGEWVDLDVDLTKPHHEDGWTWNSGIQVAARIDAKAKVWYGAMKIPFSSIDPHPPAAGTELRINLFRSQGPPSSRVQITWQPTMKQTFHVPERFGLLKLVESR